MATEGIPLQRTVEGAWSFVGWGLVMGFFLPLSVVLVFFMQPEYRGLKQKLDADPQLGGRRLVEWGWLVAVLVGMVANALAVVWFSRRILG